MTMTNRPATARTTYLQTPHGQERLATQTERDDVAQMIVTRALKKQDGPLQNQITNIPPARREVGDQLNRFLLCTLVNESSKQIKRSAQKTGATLPMSMIVRGVLRSYRRAAIDEFGPLAGPEFDIAGLRRLNETILRSEIERHTRDGVKNSAARLERAQRIGDDERIKVEKDGLEHAIELRDRLAERLR